MIRDCCNDRDGPRRMMDIIAGHFRVMSTQEKDRLMQLRLAEVRGPVRNARMLCAMTDMLLRARRINQTQERRDVDQSNL